MRTIGKWQTQQKTFLGMPIPGKTEKVYLEQEVCVYRGTKCFNVRPQDWFPDPRVTITEFQKGEFVARYFDLNMIDIVSDKESYINVKELKENYREGPASTMRVGGSERIDLPNSTQGHTNLSVLDDCKFTTGIVEGYEVIVKLIPSEWGVGTGNKAQKWVFLLMTEQGVIISAKPLGLFHDQFPYDIIEGEIDGHSRTTRSMIEIMKPLNDTLTWLINTHFYNVRKTLNDQFIVDPSRVVMKDVQDPNPGKLIRLKPAAYGQDVRTMLTQFGVQDVTRSHLNDAEVVTEMLQRVSGVKRRAQTLVTRRTVKKEWQLAWLLRAISCMDLTTLSGDDTDERVRRLCAKARQPIQQELVKGLGIETLELKVAAVCVYHTFVETAVRALEGSGIHVAAVSAGFPAGLSPLEERVAEVRRSVAAGANEIDVVITRAHVFAGKWRELYDEVSMFKAACGSAHLKVILGTGDLLTLRNVVRTSFAAMMAGADFIKTSTGKESVNATLPVGLAMTRAIREYAQETGLAVGFKPAGGIRTAKQSLEWLSLMKEELGDSWLHANLFRMGASSMLGDIERQLEYHATGRYSAEYRHPIA